MDPREKKTETITLRNLLPDVFADRDTHSEVWRQEVKLTRGDICLIEAESGAGKSSLCSFVTGYRHDYQGDILFDDTNARDLGVRGWTAVRRKHISLLWQELRLFPELTAYENIEIKNSLTRHKTRKEIMEMLEATGIADKADTKAGLMSIGQQQRVALIRSVCQPFDFLFADEPISHLDDTNSETICRLLTEEAAKQGAAIVITSVGRHPNLPYNKTLRL